MLFLKIWSIAESLRFVPFQCKLDWFVCALFHNLARETVHVGAETFSRAVTVQISDTRRVIKVNALHMQNAGNQARGTMQNVIRKTRSVLKAQNYGSVCKR